VIAVMGSAAEHALVVPGNHVVGKVNKFVGWGGLLGPPSYRN
jgi:hypothetical protein